MQAIEGALKQLLQALPRPPADKQALDPLVSAAIADVEPKTSPENRKTQWEYALRNEVFSLAATEGRALTDAATTYYADLQLRLDLVLLFTEKDACEQIFPFNLLYELLETQTIASCAHVFAWIESRADRLTEGMIPQKGKALVLLRTLNDLLRRLSKMGSTTLFCGRILTFLSQVFPLGERSGVNLRGEYGPAWDGPGVKKEEPQDVPMEVAEEKKDEMQVDEVKAEDGKDVSASEAKKQEQKDEFYKVFWSLQLPFSKPSTFTEPHTFQAFKESVHKVLPVIKEATAKERALMGSKANSGSGSLKRRREPEAIIDTAHQGYFFAKYLTSPELLDLEIADTHFRRQFLFQLLILLNHLLTFTKSAKLTWSTPRNRSLQMDFTLGSDDEKWVHETIQKTSEELRQTTPNGRAFAETVHAILEREKNWIRWKNELCAPFDKAPWAQEIEVEVGGELVKRKVGLEEATRDVRRKMTEDPPEWPHTHGSAALTDIWQMGFRDLQDLQHPFHAGDVPDFVKKIKQEDMRIQMRKKQLLQAAQRVAQAQARAAAAAASAVASAAPSPAPPASSQESAPPTAASSPAPRPAPPAAPAVAPLHPSLPAKPGTALPPPAPSPAPTPAPAPAPAPAVEAPPKPIVAPTPTPAAASSSSVGSPSEVALPPDDQLAKFEENKERWNWLGIRTARDKYLQHFGAIGLGDMVMLADAIEAARKKAAEDAAKGASGGDKEELAASQSVVSVVDKADEEKGEEGKAEDGAAAPEAVVAVEKGEGEAPSMDVEPTQTKGAVGEKPQDAVAEKPQESGGDVKMED